MIPIDCNICGRDDYSVLYPSTLNAASEANPDVKAFRCTSPDYGAHGRIVICNYCDHVYINPVFDPDELLHLYSEVEDETYQAERDGRYLTFSKHLEELEKITGPADGRRLLDVGAYTGIFVDVACKSGWDALGVEPSTWGVAEAKKSALPVIQGTLDAPELADESFDVITLWDVIEHVIDPAGELAKAYAKLKPGGVVAIHTMDIDSLTAKVMGGRWPWFMEMHIHFFGQANMCRLLEKVGYEVIWTGTKGRYLRLGYLASRVSALSPVLGTVANKVIDLMGMREQAVPVNFGDLFTVYAKKVS